MHNYNIHNHDNYGPVAIPVGSLPNVLVLGNLISHSSFTIRSVCCLCVWLQAVANESGINFISVKGPELLNMV